MSPAADLIAAQASQAYVERIFSLSGLFKAGRRNRVHRSLRMRVCLKLNSRVAYLQRLVLVLMDR